MWAQQYDPSSFPGMENGVIQFQGRKVGGVFLLHGIAKSVSQGFARLANASEHREESSFFLLDVLRHWTIWHARLGHAHRERIQKLLCTEAVTGINIRYQAVIYSDVCGPMSVGSLSEAPYFLVLVEEYSCYMKVVFITKKTDLREQFIFYRSWL